MSAGTKRIIEAYVQNGGVTMDEDHFQAYKLSLLTKWLDHQPMLELISDFVPGVQPQYCCTECPNGRTERMSVDEAVAHLKVHRPEWFLGTTIGHGKAE